MGELFQLPLIFQSNLISNYISMYKYILFSVVLFCQLFSGYKVGEKISISDQNIPYEYCYPNDSLLNTSFSFSKHSGKVFMIEMSTSW